MDRQLTAKQKVFCGEYIIDFNATQASIRAGYSKSSARQQGARLLTNAAIQSCVTKLVQTRLASLAYDAHALLSDMLEVFVAAKEEALREGGSQQITAFKGMADSVGKHVMVAAFKETIDHNHRGEVRTITRRIVDPKDVSWPDDKEKAKEPQ